MRLHALALASCLAVSPSSAADVQLRYPFRQLSIEQGLAQSQVRSIVEDHEGRLWAATAGGGLNVWDGFEMRTIGIADGLAADLVLDLDVDSSGAILVATYQGGLNRIVGESIDNLGDGLPAGLAFDVLAASDGRVWVAFREEGVAMIADSNTYLFSDELPDLHAQCLVEDSRGSIWVGLRGWIAEWSTEGWQAHRLPPPLDQASINEIAVDGESLLLGTLGQGLWRWHDDEIEQIAADILDDTRVIAIEVEETATIIGTENQGLFILGSKVEHITEANGLCSDNLLAIHRDREGGLWLGTSGAGLCHLPSRRFALLSDGDLLDGGAIWSFHRDPTGNLWLSTNGDGLFRIAPDGTLRRFTREDGLSSQVIGSVVSDDYGRLWAGALDGGLNMLEGDRFVPIDRLGEIELPRVFHIDPAGDHLWLSIAGGLVDLPIGPQGAIIDQARHWGLEEGLPVELVNDVLAEADGSVWIGTEGGGLGRLRDEKIEFWGLDEGVPSVSITSLYRDTFDQLWIAAYGGGLVRVRELESNLAFEVIDTADGLIDNGVLSILDDRRGRLWLATNRGLSALDIEASTEGRIEIVNYGAGEGFPGLECNQNSALADTDGSLYFGTIAGGVVYRPWLDFQRPLAPILSFAGVRIAGIAQDLLSMPARLDLDPKQNHLGFELSAISLTSPESVRLRWRLEGFEESFSPASTQRTVTYAGVPPGDYRFIVEASRDGGPASLLRLPIHLDAPWWSLWWVRGLGLVGLVSFGFLIAAGRTRVVEARNRRLETLVAERTRSLAERGDQLQQIDTIVRTINAELDLSRLLHTVLRQVLVSTGADAGLAYILDSESLHFDSAERVGQIRVDPPASILRDEAESRFELDGDECATGVFFHLGLALGDGTWPALVLRVGALGDAKAYLVLLAGTSGFVDGSSDNLAALEQHVLSALTKARMLDELRALNDQKNELLGIAAHDLRSPLGTLTSWSELALQDLEKGQVEPEKLARRLGRMRSIAERMSRLVNELLDLSSIESGRLHLVIERLEVASLLDETRLLHEDRAIAKGISLEVTGDDSLPTFEADRDRVLEILDNLVSNAIKYTEPGGLVSLSAKRDSDNLIFVVEDDGVGLAADEVPHLFRSFSRLSAKPTGGEQSYGLGLAIVRKIVDQHGGKVWAESTLAEGSIFYAALPIESPRS